MNFINKQAPNFIAEAVQNDDFKTINLENLRGQYVLLFFYPMDFTFVCPTEIIELNNKLNEFKKLNTIVLTCSTDSKYSHLEWLKIPQNKGGLGGINLLMLDDKSHDIAEKYNVLVDSGEDKGAAYRALFIINKEGLVKHLSINDLPVSRNVEEILRLIEAFQFNEEHGTACPMKWKETKQGIETDPVKSKKYFEENYK